MARRGQNSSDKIFQRKKLEQTKKDSERQKLKREQKVDIIMACEDSVSAPTYFKLIVQKLLDDKHITPDSFVIAIPHHTNPSGVLEDLKKHKTSNGKTYKDFMHKWIVIDRDIQRVNGGGHSKEDFNLVLLQAKKDKVEVACSNDAFELWYLLHFDYIATALLRDEINERLIKRLKEKNPHKFAKLNKENIKQANFTKLIFEELQSLQEVAMRNAKKLLESYGVDYNPEKSNPSTTVHKLVEILSNLDRKG
jgi:hypothetical protein